MKRHGIAVPRGMNPPSSPFAGFGRFGRLFPALYPFHPDEDSLKKLGAPGGPMDEGKDGGKPDPPTSDSDRIAAGFTFLGQFIDHDITLDTTSSLERQNDPDGIANFRTSFLELDSVYGLGPEAQPFLYEHDEHNQFTGRLLIKDPANPGPRDLPRNAQGRALIGDPRNDENVILAQLHFAFLEFHNHVLKRVLNEGIPEEEAFEEAQRRVRWHYQYLVVNEFLPLICGDATVADILDNGRKLYLPEHAPDWHCDPFMPVEFSVAAYRFGHSQVRAEYTFNDNNDATLFGLMGSAFRPLQNNEVLDWKRFFEIDGSDPQASRKIDPRLPSVLLDLPFIDPNNEGDPALKSLAVRNLLRGRSFCPPSGQSIARYLCGRCDPAPAVYTQKQLGLAYLPDLREAPLWFYVLREAKLETNGEHLGALGGRIVAETLIGLLQLDPMSYLHLDPCWTPDYADTSDPDKPRFGMAELLKIAAVV